MKTVFLTLLFVVVALAHLSAFAGAMGADKQKENPVIVLKCPAAVFITRPEHLQTPNKDVSPEFIDLPKDWQAIEAPERHELLQANISEGHPRERAFLVPDEKGFLLTSPSQKPYWLTCEYENVSHALVREIPKEATTCQIFTEKFKFGSNPRAPYIKDQLKAQCIK